MKQNYIVIVSIFFCLIVESMTATVATAMMPSPSVKSGVAQVVNLNFTGSSITSTINFPSAFTSNPRLAYGLKQYRGNDTFYQEVIQVTLQSLSTTSFSIKIVNESYTRVRLCSYSYIAIDSGFNHHLNAFYDVKIDNGQSAWNSMNAFSNTLLTYTSTKDYAALCSSSPGTELICSFSSLTDAKIVIFLSAFDVLKTWNSGALQFTLNAVITDATHFSLTATTQTKTALKLIRLGIVIYDKAQLQSNGYYPFSGGFNAPNTGYNYAFNESLQTNFIMSLLYFSASGGDCGLHYSWNFTGSNQINVPVYALYPGGNASCTQDNGYTTYFYMYQLGCNNPSYPYYYSVDGLCHDNCPDYTTQSGTTCIDCSIPCFDCNPAAVSTCTACEPSSHREVSGGNCVCQSGYVINPADVNGPCQPDCNTLYPSCNTCSTTPFQCILCDTGYSLRNDGTCQACSNLHCISCDPASTQCYTCDPSSDYFMNGTSNQCQHCSQTILYCDVCSAITVCTSCDTTNDFRTLVSGVCQCITGYAQPTTPGSVCLLCSNFIPNCQECSLDGSTCSKCLLGFSLFPDNTCQPCSILNCLDCSQTDTTCFQCDTLNGYFLNVTNECQTCTGNIPYCINCVDLATCTACDTTNDNRQLVGNTCTCVVGTYEPTVPDRVCLFCSSTLPNCDLCTIDGSQCTSCQSGFWLLPNNDCEDCSLSYCLSCSQTAQVCFSCDTTSQYYLNPNNNLCQTCLATILYCISCSDYQTCDSCDSNDRRQLINQQCVCQLGYYQPLVSSSVCSSCPISISNCQQCISDVTNTLIQCLTCLNGYSLRTNNVCDQCSNYHCLVCDPTSVQCLQCDLGAQYFKNGTTLQCQHCSLAHCITCSSLTTCVLCNETEGYGVNSVGICQMCSITCGCNGYGLPKINGICTPICGDGLIRLDEQCDDGNLQNQDGCSRTCKVEKDWVCINQPSCCYLDSINYQFWLQKVSIIKNPDKNHITVTLNLNPQVPILTKLSLGDSIKMNLTSQQYDQNSYQIVFDSNSFNLIIDFDYLQTIQNEHVKFYFKTRVTTDHCQSNPDAQIIIELKSDNNLPLVSYTPDQYKTKQALKGFWYGMQAASYIVLLGSLLPCKIVGLQLFGVLQLIFFSMSQYEDTNIFMTPILGMKQLNGYNMFLFSGKDQVPNSIEAMSYNANFIQNCNIMLWLLLAQLILGAIIYLMTILLSGISQTFVKIAKHLLKQVLITLILFNILNISFSVALHFIYASPSSHYYVISTLFAIVSLFLPVGIIFALFFADAKQFGQFKNKFKAGRVCKSYFVVTIFYRMTIGIYLASKSQSEITSLILLSFSIFFLMYNFVNLPYTDAYQNYRANICHLTQFVTLFVAMFFRSMKSSTGVDIKTRLFSPVLILLVCVSITLIVSFIVLCYEFYKFIASCFEKENSSQVINQISITEPNASHQSVLHFNQFGDKKQEPSIIFEQA